MVMVSSLVLWRWMLKELKLDWTGKGNLIVSNDFSCSDYYENHFQGQPPYIILIVQ